MNWARVEPVLKVLLAVVMMGAGVLHFVAPLGYASTVPSYLPAPAAWK